MTANTFRRDDAAVSPVIGVILMVAITVLLAATTASFVMGMGDSASENQSPTVAWNVQYAAGGSDSVSVVHNGGDSVDPATVDVVVTGAESTDASDAPNGQYNLVDDFGASGDSFAAGLSVEFDGSVAGVDTGAGDELVLKDAVVRVVWQSPDGGTSVTMATWKGPAAR